MNARRVLLLGLASTLLVACTTKEARCRNCGMRIDPASQWRAELVAVDGTSTAFDTPRCALQSWRGGKTPAKSVRVQDYYERRMHDGAEVRFMLGGDIVGPMGPDLVPVEPALVSKFIQDHGAERALRLDEVTLDTLSAK